MNDLRSTNSLQPIPATVLRWLNHCFVSHRTYLGWAAAVLAIASINSGCSEQSPLTESVAQVETLTTEGVARADSPTSQVAAEQSVQLPVAATQQEAPEEVSGLLGKAEELLRGAKQVTGQQASDTGQWLKGAWDGASDSTGSAVDGSLEWADKTFKSLKDQGLTTASSTGQWLSEDWQNMESWQYKVLPTGAVPAEELEDKLNKLGKQGWECFSVDDQRMIFKKASESYLRRLPFKDVLRLAPLLNQLKQ